MTIYSMRGMRRQKARDRRAEERRLIYHEKWDDLPTHYPKNIIWEYW